MALSSSLYCGSCGTANPAGAAFCFRCGRPLQSASVSTGTGPDVTSGGLLHQRYRLLNEAGRGGFGAVYKVEDTQLGNRLVAVKEMSQQSGTSPQENVETTEAFKREALLLAELMHPNLPRIYDHFYEAGRWYLVMDFIEGETLEDYLDKRGGHLTLEESIAIGTQLCDVLGYLHTRQPPIIFRDLKPLNIMRTADGHLYLIDFGIARHFKPGQTRDTVAFGSPGYAAPEQYGKTQTTPRSDIYSLGSTLYQLLTGIDPSLTPFRFAPLKLPGQPAPADLSALIMRMLEMDEEKRPASMAEIKQELQRIAVQVASGQFSTVPAPTSVTATVASARVARSLPPMGMLFCTHSGAYTSIRSIAWSPDGTQIVSSGNGNVVQVWDAASGKTLFNYGGHSGDVRAVAWSPDGTQIASGGEDKTVQIWDAATGKQLHVYKGHKHYVTSLDWSPNSQYVVSGSIDKTAQVWEAASGRRLVTYHEHGDVLYRVSWSSDGTRIASGGYDTIVRIWHAYTGNNIVLYRGHVALVRTIAWAPGSAKVVSGSYDTTVQVWDATIGIPIVTYRGHMGLIHGVAWSPDGTRIASCSSDGTVQVWDASSGQKIFVYKEHAFEVKALAWSPDGNRIASGGNDNVIQVWQA